MKMNAEGVLFAIFLGALAALPPIATDMALPALTQIGQDLHTAPAMAGLTLSLFMAGFAISPFFYGPLSDRYGRKPLLFTGLLLFTLGGVASVLVADIRLLLGARLVQGLGAGAGMTLAMAMVRDLFEGQKAQSRLALITVVANIAPIIAPAMGAALLAFTGWRGIYAAIAFSGVLLLVLERAGLRETAHLPPGPKPPFVGKLLQDYRIALGHGPTMAHILLNALGFGWMFAYVAASPVVFIDQLQVSPAFYTLIFACTGGGIVAGATLSGRLSHKGVSSRWLLLGAVLVALAASALLCGLSLLGKVSVASLVPLLVVCTAAFGVVAPCAAHGALQPLAQQAGVTGGLLTSVQMLAGAVASSVVAFLLPAYGTLGLTATMLVFALLALLVVLLIVRQPAHQPLVNAAG